MFIPMRFFSKIVFICNCCFVAAVILRWVENAKKIKGNINGALILRPLESMIVVLGYGAIIINLIFNISMLMLFLLKKEQPISKRLIWLNFLFLVVQVYYFFL
jgi:hypothetical protein